MSDYIEIFIDGVLELETDNHDDVRSILFGWFMETPFWRSRSCIIKYYHKIHKNKDYICRNDILEEESEEKNLFFMEGDNPYICLRCRKPSEIVGFCQKCYDVIYGLAKKDISLMKLSDVKCNVRFISVVKADPEYTEKIKQSILKDGMKNPIVIDKDNRILIGHHRYYIAKELGWDKIKVVKNNIDYNHGLFYEGKGSDIFIIKKNGALFSSTTKLDDVLQILLEFGRHEIEGTLLIECFINAGSDIRLRNVFIPERGDVVDPTWHDWYIRKYNKKPKIGKFS